MRYVKVFSLRQDSVLERDLKLEIPVTSAEHTPPPVLCLEWEVCDI